MLWDEWPAHPRGIIYRCREMNATLFEDLTSDSPRYYAWIGDWDDHDRVPHTRVCDTWEAAVEQVKSIL